MHTKYFDNHFDKAFLMATKPTWFSGIFITDWRFGFMIGYMKVLIVSLLVILSSCDRLYRLHFSISEWIVGVPFVFNFMQQCTNSIIFWRMEQLNHLNCSFVRQMRFIYLSNQAVWQAPCVCINIKKIKYQMKRISGCDTDDKRNMTKRKQYKEK